MNAGQAVMARIPKLDVIRKDVERTRKAANQVPPDPKTLLELVIPDAYKMYGKNGTELFLLADTGAEEEDSERILIFGRQSHERWSHQVQHLFVDGTFKVNSI